jgi:nitrite reductase (NADH) small subunit
MSERKRLMKEFVVASVDEIPIGQCKVVEIQGRSIGVFNVNGEFFAVRNICPHQGAPLCKGKIVGIHECGDHIDNVRLIREGEFIRCPWHGWEFDIKTGKSIIDPQKCFVRSYEVSLGPHPIEAPQAETFPTSVREDYVFVHM